MAKFLETSKYLNGSLQLYMAGFVFGFNARPGGGGWEPGRFWMASNRKSQNYFYMNNPSREGPGEVRKRSKRARFSDFKGSLRAAAKKPKKENTS